MKTENIDYLLTTIQCGSIYKASKFLNVAPQHLRAILNSIEDEVGVKLLVRDKQKGCYVSEQGRYFVEQLEQINNITRDIIDVSKAKQGLFSFPEEDELFIFAQSNIHTYLFKGLLEMRRIYESVGKKLRINYLELVSREIINNVLLSSNAVGLITLPDNIEIEDYLPNGLKYIEIAKRNWVVLVAANSPFLRRYKRMTIQDILSCDHVIYQSSLEVEMHTYQYLQQYGEVNVAYSTNNISMFYDLLGSGKYIYVGIERNNKLVTKKNIVEIPIKEPFAAKSVLIYQPEFGTYSINQWLIDYWSKTPIITI